ncbi:uncharacterized protein RSE6_02126 [Rhynchosporium secalis]|uniref:USP domain-containing protein n=1 Tax=Rhynchosporium secalis TaxID=38038 RepID=A0A1E1LZH5_RHYSE|nr:uncharacterized protein RSE6_02126 [Rhynchosporium secalis]
MAREYLKSWRSPPKTYKIARISKSSVHHQAPKYRIRPASQKNVSNTQFRYSASGYRPLHSKLPHRSRHNFEMVSKTRSNASSGPKSFSPPLPRSGPLSMTAPPQTSDSPSKSESLTKSAPLSTTASLSQSTHLPKSAPSSKSASVSRSALPKLEPPPRHVQSDRTGSISPKRARTETADHNDTKSTKRVKVTTDIQTAEVSKTSTESLKKDTRKKKPRRASLTADVRRDWDRMPVASQQGFENITGAICYRNSAVQALFHIPGFVNWVMDHLQPEKCSAANKNLCVSCCLYSLATKYWEGSKVAETWRRFNTILRRRGWGVDAGNGQADAGEQLIWIFDAMSKELPTETYAQLEHMFRIKSASIVSCGTCSHTSISNPGNQYILNIPVQRNITTLSENIQKHLAAEVLQDYKCESCGKTANNRKTLEITRLPELICIQLNRIGWNRKTGKPVMNRTAVNIPTTLDLSSHQKKKGGKGGKNLKKIEGEQKKIEYELLSVVKHSGSAAFGHYICAAVGPDGAWKLFDDRSVTKSSAAQATRGGHFDPFIMYYQRKRA